MIVNPFDPLIPSSETEAAQCDDIDVPTSHNMISSISALCHRALAC
jgi:hypothetical protein